MIKYIYIYILSIVIFISHTNTALYLKGTRDLIDAVIQRLEDPTIRALQTDAQRFGLSKGNISEEHMNIYIAQINSYAHLHNILDIIPEAGNITDFTLFSINELPTDRQLGLTYLAEGVILANITFYQINRPPLKFNMAKRYIQNGTGNPFLLKYINAIKLYFFDRKYQQGEQAIDWLMKKHALNLGVGVVTSPNKIAYKYFPNTISSQ